jgi:hypothetical protein
MPARIRVFSPMAAIVVLAGTLGGTPAAMAASHALPAVTETAFGGLTFGTEVRVGSVVESRYSAPSTIGCTAQTGVTHTNSVASVTVPKVVSTGTVDTSAASQTISTGVASTTSATTQDVSLLGGLVTATTVGAVSTTSQSSTTHRFSTSAAGTQFADLSVDGTPVSGTPAPNTKMMLPGVGYVILNQQSPHVYRHLANLDVMGIHLVVTMTTAAAKAGTQVFVSDADSDMGGPVSGLLYGLAYGTGTNTGFYKVAHYTFPQPMGCTGTNGRTDTNTGAAVKIPKVLTTGTVTDTVTGTDTSSAVSGTVTSTVQNIDLADGMVTATSIDAVAAASGNPPALTNGSTFVGLSVEGKPISGTPAPNTKMSLPGIGTLWLNRQYENAWRLSLSGILLDVTVPGNPLKLKPGTMIQVAWSGVAVN